VKITKNVLKFEVEAFGILFLNGPEKSGAVLSADPVAVWALPKLPAAALE
jgi:hypothetical protein